MYQIDHKFNQIHNTVTFGENVSIGAFCKIEEGCVIHNNVTIGDYVKIKADTIIQDGVVLGSYVRTGGMQTIGAGTVVKCRATLSPEVEVGRDCFIGPHSLLLHATPKGTHNPCGVEDNGYIGSHVTVLPGVIVGKNALVGTGAVVTKNVEPETTVLGIPAKPVA
jgi:tetrahydrodipicolinate N-acetyltransferase